MHQYQWVLLAVALAGCAGPYSQDEQVPPEPRIAHETWESIPAVGAQGSVLTQEQFDLGRRPDNFTGIIVEARVDDGVRAEPLLIHRFRLASGEGTIAETAEPDANGVYRIVADPTEWTDGRVTLIYTADGSRLTPTASTATRGEFYSAIYADREPEWNVSLFETA